MRKIKKCVIAVCLVCMVMNGAFSAAVFASENSSVTEEITAQKRTEIFTIDKAVEYAKEHSYTLESLKNSEEAAKYSEDSVRFSYKQIRKAENYGASNLDSLLQLRGYYHRMAQYQHRAAQRAVISAEYELQSNVELAFYDYINAKKKTDYAKEDFEKAQERHSFAKTKYELGTVSALELESFSLAEVNAQNTLNSAIRTQNSKLMSLKSLINYPLEDELELIGSFERHEMDTTSVDKAMELYNGTIEKANLDENFDLATEKYNCSINYYTSGRYEFFQEKAEYANTQGQYKQSENTKRIAIQNAYDQMVSMYETLDYLDKNLEYTKAQAEAARLRYEQGTITSVDYLDAVAQLSNLQNTIADTELGAWQSVVAYKKLFDCKNTVFAK